MPQLDKLLAHIAPRGGTGLILEPERQPMLQMAGGGPKQAPQVPGHGWYQRRRRSKRCRSVRL